MRVNAAAVVGAVLAAVVAVVGDAVHPAQVVVASAAACGFGALLSRGRRVAPGDWFTVQILLAGNLVVLGISDAHQLGAALAGPVVAAGVLLLLGAIRMHRRWPRRRRRNR